MAKLPIILFLDDDAQVFKALQADLRSQFRKEYRILGSTSALEALAALADLKKQNEEVALLLSDQRMPELLGVDFLEQAKKFFPRAKRVLLTAYSDIDAAIRAINEVQLDYYLSKPWDPPEEKLFPVLADLLDEWQAGFRPSFEGIRVVGYQFSPKSHEIKDFLAGNLFAYEWLEAATNPQAQALLQLHGLNDGHLPLVVLADGTPLPQPTLLTLAERLGLKVKASQAIYDVVIIGAGPAGLAAAVYGGSEGLRTLMIEKKAPGGQAGTSSRIENYLGFPSGLSGGDLTRRAVTQATRLGAELLAQQEVVSIKAQHNVKLIGLADGSEVVAKSIIISTGVEYRQLDTPGMAKLAGAGVYYGAATTEANACANQPVFVVGGGNSAGQGAMYLSRFAQRVFIVIRKPDLSSTMSQYLIDQIAATPNIEVVSHTEVVEALGEENLTAVKLENIETHTITTRPAAALFVFIGTKPRTEWLQLDMIKDDKGFIETGRNLFLYPAFKRVWKLERDPYFLETCYPGIFAAGDVRAGAMNRVASAVGEGAMAISFVHKYLAET
jgi:thioredoxin reductase (NADPH)